MFTFIAADVININLLALIVIGLVVIAAVVWIQEGQRRIPVQYAKRVVDGAFTGQYLHSDEGEYGRVIPVIFAVSVLAFPATVAQFWQHPLAQRFGRCLATRRPHMIIQFLISSLRISIPVFNLIRPMWRIT